MRKFKFVGDPLDYSASHAPVVGSIYTKDYKHEKWMYSVEELVLKYPEDWKEVKEKIPNQDQPASEMTKFEMAVFMAMQGLISLPDYASIDIARECIAVAKETFKQLNELK